MPSCITNNSHIKFFFQKSVEPSLLPNLLITKQLSKLNLLLITSILSLEHLVSIENKSIWGLSLYQMIKDSNCLRVSKHYAVSA